MIIIIKVPHTSTPVTFEVFTNKKDFIQKMKFESDKPVINFADAIDFFVHDLAGYDIIEKKKDIKTVYENTHRHRYVERIKVAAQIQEEYFTKK